MDVVAGRPVVVRTREAWSDWGQSAGPGGYDRPLLRIFGWLRRRPADPWFALELCVDRKPVTCRRWTEGAMTFPVGGRLTAFANDAWFMYWNNAGAIEVRVEPIPSAESPPDVLP